MQLLFPAVIPTGAALAVAPLSHERLGVNFTGAPPNLATASAAGVGLARDQVIAGTDTDAVVQLAAAAHLRLYPMRGPPRGFRGRWPPGRPPGSTRCGPCQGARGRPPMPPPWPRLSARSPSGTG